MTATTKDRNTSAKLIHREIVVKVKANTVIPAGALVMKATATGLAENAADTAGMTIVGRAEHAFDNTSAAVPPDTELICATGVFAYIADAAVIALADAALLTTVYIADNQTVTTAAIAANDIPVGRLEEIVDGKYYIAIGMGV